MKTNKILLLTILAFSILFSGCKEEVRMPELTKVVLPSITIEPNSDLLIQDGVLNGKFKVDMYYKDAPDDASIVIVRNGDYANPKVFKSGLKTFPIVETLNDAQLKELFNVATIESGDKFEIGLDVKVKETWYPAFISTETNSGPNYGPNVLILPKSSPVLTYRAVCKLVMDNFNGVATVVDPYWYEGTYTANIEKVDATHLKFKNFAEFAGDIILTIDPETRNVTVLKQTFDVDLAAWGMAKYTNPSASGTGFIDACKNEITLTLDYTVDQGSFGSGPVTITMNN
ncbi:MAG TPA: hypothetical protein VK152_04105 [Paludibacter sp.]|nr:hypothetical protein [Paludibacter sp.]